MPLPALAVPAILTAIGAFVSRHMVAGIILLTGTLLFDATKMFLTLTALVVAVTPLISQMTSYLTALVGEVNANFGGVASFFSNAESLFPVSYAVYLVKVILWPLFLVVMGIKIAKFFYNFVTK